MVEKKASGQSLIQDMRRAGLPVLEYQPDRDKVARVYAASP
jgi:phage terminase large subunit-like protein